MPAPPGGLPVEVSATESSRSLSPEEAADSSNASASYYSSYSSASALTWIPADPDDTALQEAKLLGLSRPSTGAITRPRGAKFAATVGHVPGAYASSGGADQPATWLATTSKASAPPPPPSSYGSALRSPSRSPLRSPLRSPSRSPHGGAAQPAGAPAGPTSVPRGGSSPRRSRSRSPHGGAAQPAVASAGPARVSLVDAARTARAALAEATQHPDAPIVVTNALLKICLLRLCRRPPLTRLCSFLRTRLKLARRELIPPPSPPPAPPSPPLGTSWDLLK